MAIIMTFGNQKGGVGKSTITALVANSLSQDFGYRVLILDVDMQYSIGGIRTQILQNNPNASFSYHYEKTLFSEVNKKIEEKDDDYDIILVDIPGILKMEVGKTDHVMNLLTLCDLVVVPIKPRLMDIKSSLIFLQNLKRIKEAKVKSKIPFEYRVLINFSDNTSMSKTVKGTFDELKIKTLQAVLSDLNEYSEKVYSNKSILKHSLKSPKIRGEFTEFIEELEKIIQTL